MSDLRSTQRLTFAATSRRVGEVDCAVAGLNSPRSSPVAYREFLIDGTPLWEILQTRVDDLAVVSSLQDDWPEESWVAVKEFLGDWLASEQLVTLYLCPVCAEQCCATVTAQLSIEAETVTWSQFEWNPYNPDSVHSQGLADLRCTFVRSEYEAIVRAELARTEHLLGVVQAEREVAKALARQQRWARVRGLVKRR